MIINLILFLSCLLILIKCADYSIKYSTIIARVLRFPEFIISFFVVALISVLPEAIISIFSAIKGAPEMGLGTLLGSNVADLSLVFGIVALFSYNGINVKSKILRNNFFYLILLLFPLILGFDGRFSRLDGIALILAGSIFLIKIYTEKNKFHRITKNKKREPIFKNLFFLVTSILILLLVAYYTVKFAVNFSEDMNLPAIITGITLIAFGTCLPELIFSIKAVRKNRDELALGDILGTVIIDATIILGIIALISPFNHNPYDLYVTGTAMFISGILVTIFMKSNKVLNKFEGILLILFYILFLITEFFVNNLIAFR